MDVTSTFVAHGESPKSVEPRKCALNYPPYAAEVLVTLDAPSCDSGNHTSQAAGQSLGLGVIRLVGVQLTGAASGTPSRLFDWSQRVQHRFEHSRIMHVGCCECDVQRNPAPIDEQVVLRAQFPPVSR